MALVKLIDEAEATGKVKAIFDDIKATKGIERVPNIWRALAKRLALFYLGGGLKRTAA